MDEVGEVRALRYIFSQEGVPLLALDCHQSLRCDRLTFGQLLKELGALCPWQLHDSVMIGHSRTVVDVVTLYHAFEFARCHGNTLMLVSTPPDEYFEAAAA